MPIEIVVDDITKIEVCAIVNAANSSLMGGGGVDGAIHRAGGKAILQECKKIRQTQYKDGLPTGKAVATTGGNLLAKYVIHTVGPIWGKCGSECDKLLKDAYCNSLQLSLKLGCKSIAFPAISTGIYGFPKDRAAKIAYYVANEFIKIHPDMKIIFVFHSDGDKKIFEEAINS